MLGSDERDDNDIPLLLYANRASLDHKRKNFDKMIIMYDRPV